MYTQTWNLHSLFEGGDASSSPLHTLTEKIKKESDKKTSSLEEEILLLQELHKMVREVESFAACLTAQDTTDEKATALLDTAITLKDPFLKRESLLEETLASLSEEEFDNLLKSPPLKGLVFTLKEKRQLAQEKLPLKEENMITSLSGSGYHAHSSLYEQLLGSLRFPFQGNSLAFSQMENIATHSDQAIRKEAFDSMMKVFEEKGSLFSGLLNALSGFRLSVYKLRGWNNPLKEPLMLSRMSTDTLESMWKSVRDSHQIVHRYLKRKAQLLGQDKLHWYDLEAPIGEGKTQFSYRQGAEFVIRQFEKKSPKMAQFAKMALEKGWIESKESEKKQGGGFCTCFPMKKESRIFMTYQGSISHLLVLAHELGHAFHSHLLFDLPEYNQHYPMNVAETASTIAEQIFIDGALEELTGQDKTFLLEQKLQRSACFLLNIESRFLFEKMLYEKRKEGYLSQKDLSSLMEKAQREAYGESVDTLFPYFWAAKHHFYLTSIPFYNFPYTFGYLFSLFIYESLKDEKEFDQKYCPFLEDTGRLFVEDLAKKHFNANTRQEDFWKKPLDSIEKNVTLFLNSKE